MRIKQQQLSVAGFLEALAAAPSLSLYALSFLAATLSRGKP